MTEVYLITKINIILCALTVTLCISIVTLFYSIVDYNMYTKKCLLSSKWIKVTFIVFIVSLIGLILIPTKNDLLLMYKVNHPNSDITNLIK